jgi:hypothetical protein
MAGSTIHNQSLSVKESVLESIVKKRKGKNKK